MNMEIYRAIRIRGIVQGVGFRPFIYRLAAEHSIRGTVINDTEGVYIEAAGRADDIKNFTDSIKTEKPLNAVIHSIEILQAEDKGFSDFNIGESTSTPRKNAFYSPDLALCPDCLKEFSDPVDRRYRYPFICCINCGPRFSIVSDVPYDRRNTSMKNFPLCGECAAEYSDPLNRRHHTQPTACPVCGPVLSLREGSIISEKKESAEIIEHAVLAITRGKIAAVKGIGGYHLACDAQNSAAVAELRRRKQRPFKPFAVMCPSIKAAEKICLVTPAEKKLLLSKESPVVLLEKKRNSGISPETAPGLRHLGVMLPHAPVHYLLFEKNPDMLLIMTSGNISDEPIAHRDEDAFSRLEGIADLTVSGNREIISRCDDSVMFVEREKPFFVRRSRGFIPAPIKIKNANHNIFAMGGDLKNCFAAVKEGYAVQSQYMGDMEDPLSCAAYEETMEHYRKIYDFEPIAVASDMHPSYFTVRHAEKIAAGGIRHIRVQHHHAHIASILAEKCCDDKVIGIAFDGTGYGPDGTLWGGEFLIADTRSFTRAGHFSYFPLPGGERSIKEVWRTGLSLLYSAYGDDIPIVLPENQKKPLIEIIKKNINCPLSCSTGRIFDGISAILGLSRLVSCEAEAAILLEESAADGTLIEFRGPSPENGECITIPVPALVREVTRNLLEGASVPDIALSFHRWLAETAVKTLDLISGKTGIKTAALSGGTFQNRLLLNLFTDKLKSAGYKVLLPEKVPFNDGCLALGQAAVAAELMKDRSSNGA